MRDVIRENVMIPSESFTFPFPSIRTPNDISEPKWAAWNNT